MQTAVSQAPQQAQLGFGTGILGGKVGRKASLRLLEIAFDSGIRYFDTAPMYGYGAMEAIVGEFASHRRDQLRLGSKFGIEPASSSPLLSFARSGARSVASVFPSLRARLVQRGEQMITPGNFDPDFARMSLQRSLNALQTSYLDIFLMHDVRGEQITPELVKTLEQAQESGWIRHFGIASTRDEAQRIRDAGCPAGDVLQVPDAFPQIGDAFDSSAGLIITHSIFGRQWEVFRKAVRDPQVSRNYSALLDCDCTNTHLLGRLFLSAAIARNPSGIILFSSRSPETIRANAQLLVRPEFSSAQCRTLGRLVRNLTMPAEHGAALERAQENA